MESETKRFMSLRDVVSYLGISQVTARNLMEMIGATRKITPRRCVYDRQVIDEYIDSLGEQYEKK